MTWTHTALAQKICFGSVEQVAGVADELGCRRLMLITTKGRRESAAGQRVIRLLGSSLAHVFDGVRSHVPKSAVEQAVAEAKQHGADGVVSFGGGSCSDLGKAVCFHFEQERGAGEARWFQRSALPHIAIPTAYAGAELTPYFGVTDESTRRKSGGGSLATAPVAVIYDPELTLDLPARVSAETGMNALAHCVEAAWSTARSAEAEVIAYAGAARIYRWLPIVTKHPHDLRARSEMLVGAMLGGRALQNAAMGVHHGLAQLVGGCTGMPHGLANAVILAHAVRFNANAVPDVIWRLTNEFGRTDGDAASAIDELRERIGLPARLSECGFTRADLDTVVKLSTGNPNLARNPKPVGESDVRAILEAAY